MDTYDPDRLILLGFDHLGQQQREVVPIGDMEFSERRKHRRRCRRAGGCIGHSGAFMRRPVVDARRAALLASDPTRTL